MLKLLGITTCTVVMPKLWVPEQKYGILPLSTDGVLSRKLGFSWVTIHKKDNGDTGIKIEGDGPVHISEMNKVLAAYNEAGEGPMEPALPWSQRVPCFQKEPGVAYMSLPTANMQLMKMDYNQPPRFRS